jgi:hypothetical protein
MAIKHDKNLDPPPVTETLLKACFQAIPDEILDRSLREILLIGGADLNAYQTRDDLDHLSIDAEISDRFPGIEECDDSSFKPGHVINTCVSLSFHEVYPSMIDLDDEALEFLDDLDDDDDDDDDDD